VKGLSAIRVVGRGCGVHPCLQRNVEWPIPRQSQYFPDLQSIPSLHPWGVDSTLGGSR